jgi:hypothetical protein
MISRSVKELLKQITIRGMYFYSIKSAFTAFMLRFENLLP